MEVLRRSSGLLLLLGLFLLTITLQGVQGEVEVEPDGPSESECRPYIEKALRELEAGEAAASTSAEGDSKEDIPTVEITDDSDHQDSDGEKDDNNDDGQDSKESQIVSEKKPEPEVRHSFLQKISTFFGKIFQKGQRKTEEAANETKRTEDKQHEASPKTEPSVEDSKEAQVEIDSKEDDSKVGESKEEEEKDTDFQEHDKADADFQPDVDSKEDEKEPESKEEEAAETESKEDDEVKSMELEQQTDDRDEKEAEDSKERDADEQDSKEQQESEEGAKYIDTDTKEDDSSKEKDDDHVDESQEQAKDIVEEKYGKVIEETLAQSPDQDDNQDDQKSSETDNDQDTQESVEEQTQNEAEKELGEDKEAEDSAASKEDNQDDSKQDELEVKEADDDSKENKSFEDTKHDVENSKKEEKGEESEEKESKEDTADTTQESKESEGDDAEKTTEDVQDDEAKDTKEHTDDEKNDTQEDTDDDKDDTKEDTDDDKNNTKEDTDDSKESVKSEEVDDLPVDEKDDDKESGEDGDKGETKNRKESEEDDKKGEKKEVDEDVDTTEKKIVKREVHTDSAEQEEETDTEKGSESTEDGVPVEDLSLDTEIPTELRSRDHVEQLLKLDDKHSETESLINRVSEITLRDLKKLYENAIKPLETVYKYRDLSNRHFGDAEIFSKPLILFMGPWSGGKSSIINYLTNNEYNDTSLRTGAEPSPAYFNILMYGDELEIIDGTELAADFTFSGLQKFGQGLEERLRGVKLPSKLLEKVNIVEIPGILEVRKQVSRVFPFNDACQWFIDRGDIIFLVYDPSKLDVGPETEAILDQLKGREHQTRIILNKADQVKPEELMRVQGALIWNISPLMSSPQPPVMYTTSLWSRPYENWAPVRLLQAQERAFLRDLRGAIDKRIENKIASARRFAVRVRNHAKMVDCYLTTYYNHKSVFGNRKQVADAIIEHPQDYHIYEGLSTLTNISRYDLPDPDVYRDFFKLNPLYEFQQLSATCTYFRGCPINRLDIAIAYDLPELLGTHKKRIENALAEAVSAPQQQTSAPGS